jgi:hypothetical protein
MEQQLSTKPNNEATAISLQPKLRSEPSKIVGLLTVLAEARQAATSTQTFEVFSSELAKYEFQDIAAAVRKLMFTKREEGETAFPDLPTLDERVCHEKNIRLKAAREERERAEAEAEERDRQEHPENYFDVRQMFHNFAKQKGIEVLPPQRQSKMVCEFCDGIQLEALVEAFSEADFLALAEVARKRDALKVSVRRV